MANRDLVVIGASAGGIEALQGICAGLSVGLEAAVLIVMHTSPSSGGLLPRILSRTCPIAAEHPEDGELIQRGKIYVAPPDNHVIVEPGRLRVIRGPRENHNRPAIDPTFRSAALHYGPRVIGVVLTGLLDDGTSGLMVIRAHGGKAVVQDPETAMFPSMPRSALQRVPDALVGSIDQIPGILKKLVNERIEVGDRYAKDDHAALSETRVTEVDMSEIESEIRVGKPSQFGCPECGGVLWEIEQGGLLRYRCRVGHAYTAQHLRAEQRHVVETALWSALRALEESASLYRKMADRAKKSRLLETPRTFEERAKNAEQNAHTLRDFLVHISVPDTAEEDETQELPAA